MVHAVVWNVYVLTQTLGLCPQQFGALVSGVCLSGGAVFLQRLARCNEGLESGRAFPLQGSKQSFFYSVLPDVVKIEWVLLFLGV